MLKVRQLWSAGWEYTMIHLPQFWGITIAAGLINAGVWAAIAFLVLPFAWALAVGGAAFAITFWVLSLMQSLHSHELSQPDRVEIRRTTRDHVDVLIH